LIIVTVAALRPVLLLLDEDRAALEFCLVQLGGCSLGIGIANKGHEFRAALVAGLGDRNDDGDNQIESLKKFANRLLAGRTGPVEVDHKARVNGASPGPLIAHRTDPKDLNKHVKK
jgi:hypothetical protein